ncbi:MAG: nucleotide-binding protein [Rubrivivax sp.]|nr:nucleotide-binding protein [Rubrivivax sp.]
MNTPRWLAGLTLAATLALPLAATAQQANTLQGEVLEVLNVDMYTYVRLKTASGEAWAAVTTAALNKGAKVTISNATPMDNFESKALKRRFERIYFGQIAGPGAKVAAGGPPSVMKGGMPGAMNTGMPGAMHMPGASPAPAIATTPVPKASGADARTVAEVVQGKAGLKDKTVLIRARVVKVNNGIMGKNWLHLQDGSGKAQDGSNDLLVTSKDTAAVGDIVTARGTVRTDVSVGPGYAYAVLVEDASVKK